MILHGDEILKTKKGNNNTYCQDNEISWVNWNLDKRAEDFLSFTRYLTTLWKEHPMLQRRNFFHGQTIMKTGEKDVSWYSPDGEEMIEKHWNDPDTRCLGMLLSGNANDEKDNHGYKIKDDTLLIIINAFWGPLEFHLPRHFADGPWTVALDTRYDRGKAENNIFAETSYTIADRSLAVLLSPRPEKWEKLRSECRIITQK